MKQMVILFRLVLTLLIAEFASLKMSAIVSISDVVSDLHVYAGSGDIAVAEIQRLRTGMEQQESSHRFAIVLICVMVLALCIALRLLLQSRKKNKIILTQNERINLINFELKEKNHSITASIEYARNFQSSITLSESAIQDVFPDSFVYFKPKDIVSGDLPFMLTVRDKVYIGCIDCVGHGVPAAMLTFITYFNLRNLIHEEPDADSGKLLSMLHKRVTKDLASEIEDNSLNVSIDMSLCMIDRQMKQICFAGAQQGVLIQEGTTLRYIRGNRHSLGETELEIQPEFEAHTFSYDEGQRIFLFSDGIVHQFDSSSKKKFALKRLKELLDNNRDLTIKGLRKTIEMTLLRWKGHSAQTDDMLLIGINPCSAVSTSQANHEELSVLIPRLRASA